MHVRFDCVVRLAGVTEDEVAVALDPLTDALPVVIGHRLTRGCDEVVDDVLDALEMVAIALFPAWLPDADVLADGSDLDRRVARLLARELASTSGHFGSFLADLAESAVAGRRPSRRFDPAMRARGLADVIAAGYGRRTGVVVLLSATDDSWSDVQQQRAGALCEWLASHGRVGSWLSPGALPAVDRYPAWHPPIPAFVGALSPGVAENAVPVTTFAPLAGRPHPASTAEGALERALARHDWAAGRVWNQVYTGNALTPPIRVDLMWPAERCVVELDGAEHRGSLHYAADRRRDNGLVVDGYAVLRFTNEDIADDPERVLGVIETLLAGRRRPAEEGNGGNHS